MTAFYTGFGKLGSYSHDWIFVHSATGGEIFQGAVPPEGKDLARAEFHMLVLCAVEHQPHAERFPGIEVLHAPNDDSGYTPTQEELVIAMRAARRVAAAVRSGKRVLVTCQAGRNRSGLVSALALHLLTGQSGARCAALVQRRRPNALTNEHFVRHLHGFREHAPNASHG